jgi:hypothetical protein
MFRIQSKTCVGVIVQDADGLPSTHSKTMIMLPSKC